MRFRVIPSVLGTMFRDDYKKYGLPKTVIFKKEYRYELLIGAYQITIEQLVESQNSYSKKIINKTNESVS